MLKLKLNTNEVETIRPIIINQFRRFCIYSEKSFNKFKDAMGPQNEKAFVNTSANDDKGEFILLYSSIEGGNIEIKWRYITNINIDVIRTFTDMDTLRKVRDDSDGRVNISFYDLVRKSQTGIDDPNLYIYINLLTRLTEFVNGGKYNYVGIKQPVTLSNIAEDALM